jgi:hypothetical protein
MQSRSERLEFLQAEEIQLGFELEEALAMREELDHSNAQVLMLHDRCNAWMDSLGRLEVLQVHTETERQALHQAFQQLIEALHAKNNAATSEHYEATAWKTRTTSAGTRDAEARATTSTPAIQASARRSWRH